LLPSLLLKYQVSKNSVVRLAGTSALARPNYYDLVPFAAFSFDDSEASFGNPNLSAARATNVDLSYESYFKNNGLVSVGGFYKYIDNFIYTKRGEEL
jgi:outer membrane receptor protein involved in Fe transport